jgi:hypothetical protein
VRRLLQDKVLGNRARSAIFPRNKTTRPATILIEMTLDDTTRFTIDADAYRLAVDGDQCPGRMRIFDRRTYQPRVDPAGELLVIAALQFAAMYLLGRSARGRAE